MVIFRSVSIVKSNHTLDVIGKHGNHETIGALDMLPTRISENGMVAIAAINKVASSEHILSRLPEGAFAGKEYRMITVNCNSADAYTTSEWSKSRFLRADDNRLQARCR